jgi:hypothetical protein
LSDEKRKVRYIGRFVKAHLDRIETHIADQLRGYIFAALMIATRCDYRGGTSSTRGIEALIKPNCLAPVGCLNW